MTDDPYKILGISETATKDEIKKAYRKKAKECHPDLHPDDPAAEEMHRVNEAYERLMNPEKYQAQNIHGNPYGAQGSWQAYDFDELFGAGRRAYGIPNPVRMAGDSETICQAVDFINIGRYRFAEQVLDAVSGEWRDARWNYLKALANYGMGNVVAAMMFMQKAQELEPDNLTYREVGQVMYRTGSTYRANGQDYRSTVVDMNRFCLGIWLTHLFCRFFGC